MKNVNILRSFGLAASLFFCLAFSNQIAAQNVKKTYEATLAIAKHNSRTAFGLNAGNGICNCVRKAKAEENSFISALMWAGCLADFNSYAEKFQAEARYGSTDAQDAFYLTLTVQGIYSLLK